MSLLTYPSKPLLYAKIVYMRRCTVELPQSAVNIGQIKRNPHIAGDFVEDLRLASSGEDTSVPNVEGPIETRLCRDLSIRCIDAAGNHTHSNR